MLTNDVFFLDDDICEFEETIVETSENYVKRSKKKKKNSKIDETLQNFLDDCDLYISVKTDYSDIVGTVFNIGGIRLKISGINEDLMALKEFWLYVSNIPNRSFIYLEVGSEVKYCGVDGNLDTELFTVPEDISHTSLVDLEALYSSVKRQLENISVGNVQHQDLVPKLRPYQERAVSWMLQKETLNYTMDIASHFFTKIVVGDNQAFFYNKYEGYLVLQEPHSELLPKGGILADEMGLGKTVEVLALILLNPSSEQRTTDSQILDKCAKIFEPKSCKAQDSASSDENYSEEEWEDFEMFQKNKDLNSSSSSQRRTQLKRRCTAVRAETHSTKRSSKGETFQALEQWYNKILSQTSVRARSSCMFLEQDKTPGLKCVCGEERKKLTRIQCCTCFDWQHVQCMGNPNTKGYNCPQCWQKMEPINSRTTLIVSPTSISNQWLLEIEKHISDKSFKTLVYRGVQKDGFLQPHFIADYHLVLTTYEILRKELVHADVNSTDQGRSLRYSKRFFAVPSPLVNIKWWRVCLDEAQMVEHSTSKTAEMANRLDAIHRWAISGTPVQKTVQDLFGLIQFLGVEPYCSQRYWTRCLYIPYCQGNTEPLHKLLDLIMWRTMKKDVLHEINIPEQTHQFHWLNFTPVEEHFYRLQHTLCTNDFILMCSKFGEINLLKPLLRLRQACSHHHVVRGFLVGQKATMTMEELLESLLKKTKLEAEECFRRTIAAMNGLAGIHIIKEMWTEAIEHYREVLRISEEYKDSLKMDTLQRIHTLHNLAEVLCVHSENIPPTLRDHKLQQEATELEEKFMNKQDEKVATAQEALSSLTSHVHELLSSFSVGRDEWWSESIMWLMTHDEKGEFLTRVHFELLENQKPGQNSIINRVKTLASVEHQLTLWSDELFQNREEALKKLQLLKEASQLDMANEAVECHLRTNNLNSTRKKKCRLCKIELFLKQYESLLFAVSNKQTQHSFVGEVMIMNHLNQGTWKPSEHERILRVLLTFVRNKRASVELLEDGNQFLKVLEALKKEFKQLRFTWTQMRDRVSVQDELHMAKLRLRIRFEDERVPQRSQKHNPLHQLSSLLTNKMETIHVIESHEVEAHAARFQSDRLQSEAELRRKIGQLQYLKNLEKNQGCKTNPDPCPICRIELGEKWSVLQCGHCFCVECIQQLMQSSVHRTINVKCPVCRDVTLSCDISFVDIGAKSQDEDKWPDTSVFGSFSTKIEAVVRCLLSIRKKQPDVKALVFSTWEKVLDVLEKALGMNEISFCRLQSGPKYKASLQLFKEEAQHVTALLIPVSLGAKGLNLIEATHVLLVDPMLNLADELQAIGRVHRIGQTKKTTVHHFFIRGTIEERIYEATRTSGEKWSDNSITVQQLKALFNSQSEICPDTSSSNDTQDVISDS
ncbi:E3 ubiquitin-protein ligase SHPRH [Gryllus bimaculatus]|nr:E3 ubiquitin-protein ligase SHPRH [Gryllus bimaculatus]